MDKHYREEDSLLLNQHHRLVENLREGLLVVDRNGIIINANKAAANLMELDCTGLLGNGIRDFLDTDNWDSLLNRAKSLPPGDTLHGEILLVKDLLTPINAALIPAYDSHQEYIGCLVLIYGIFTPNFQLLSEAWGCGGADDHECADRAIALRESEARYRLLASMTSDYAASIRVEEDGSFITEWVAGSFEELTGFPVQCEQPATLDMTHPEDIERQKQDIARTLHNEPTITEFRTIRPAGGEVWLRVSRRPIWDENLGRVVRILIVAQDITEHKMAARALEASETRYKLLSSMTSDYAASVKVKRDGSIITEWAVGSFEEITGHQVMLGEKANLSSTHEDDIDRQREDIRRTIEENVPTVTEFRTLKPNGDIVWLRVSRRPIYSDAEQRVTRFLSVAQNITERKQAEDERLKAEEELRRSQVQQAELVGIHKTVATLAHEINNPLTGIIATLQMAPDPDIPPEELQEMLEAALKAANTIRNVVAKIQELRKPSYRPYLADREIIDIRDGGEKP